MISNSFYPSLASIVSTDDLPEQLNFLDGGIESLLADIFLKDFQFFVVESGEVVAYNLVLKVYKRLSVNVPGTGIKVSLNPPLQFDPDPFSSEIPISVNVSWGIRKFIRGFNLASFSFLGQNFFDLILEVADASKTEFLDTVTFEFVEGNDLNNLVADINAFYSLAGQDVIPNPTNTVRKLAIGEIINAIEANSVLSGAEKSVSTVGFEIYVLKPTNLSDTFYYLERLCSEWIGPDPIRQISKMIFPSVVLNAKISAAIEFSRDLLLPVKPNGEVETNMTIKSRILFDAGNFKFSTYGGIGYDESLVATFDPAYPLAQIGKSPIRIGFTEARLDLSRNRNIPAAIADGRPNDFIGVAIDQATIAFPKFWQQDVNGPPSTAQIVGRKLLIGTGGFSGTIALEASNQGDLFHTRLNNPNGFAIGLHAFEVKFRQNAIIGSTIKGWLTIPGLEDRNNPGQPARIELDVSIGNDTFELTAMSQQGVVLGIPNVFDFTIHSLSIGRAPDANDPGNYKFHLALSGDLRVTATQPGGSAPVLDSSIHIEKLVIYDDGSYEFVGGVNILPRAISLELGPAKITVTALSFGSHEQLHDSGNGPILRKYAYFGFDGGLAVSPGGVDVRGDGVKLFFTIDNDAQNGMPLHVFFRVEGIYIDLVIPGGATAETAALLLKGYLAMRNPDPGSGLPLEGDPATEYMGGIDFAIPKAKIRGSAGMRLIPSVPAFLIDVGLELPVPIPLGPTGLGIYGFRGVVGDHFLPSKVAAGLADESRPWWEYYKARVKAICFPLGFGAHGTAA